MFAVYGQTAKNKQYVQIGKLHKDLIAAEEAGRNALRGQLMGQYAKLVIARVHPIAEAVLMPAAFVVLEEGAQFEDGVAVQPPVANRAIDLHLWAERAFVADGMHAVDDNDDGDI